MLKKALFLFLMLIATGSQAETYGNIFPLDTLGDLKEKYPNANFSKRTPAWASKYDAMYSIDGSGLSGTIIVKFHDYRPFIKELLSTGGYTEEEVDNFKKVANRSDEEALTVSWVRWVPAQPIPISRFVSKYGKFEKSGFSDEDLEPYRSWESKGLVAYLANDEKSVVRVDYEFTKQERRRAYKAKGLQIPENLR